MLKNTSLLLKLQPKIFTTMANSSHLSRFLTLAPIFTLLIILTPSFSYAVFPSPKSPIRVSLQHADFDINGLDHKLQLLRRSLARNKQRPGSSSQMTETTPHNNNVRVLAHAGDSVYLLNISIGTPPVPISGVIDTAGDLVWTQCQPCVKCYEQTTPVFDPTNSSSFMNISCPNELCGALHFSRCKSNGCEYSYESMTEGLLAFETMKFGEHDESNNVRIAFGCGVNNERVGLETDKATGVIGLSRSRLSLVSQLGVKEFSYCLAPPGENQTSSLWFGPIAGLNRTGAMSTPLIRSFHDPTPYYLSLKGITVGETLLPIPKSVFGIREGVSGGMILDSTTTTTRIDHYAFSIVKHAFVTQMNRGMSDENAEYDMCFDLPRDGDGIRTDIYVPRLVFHFEGMDMEFRRENYMVRKSGMMCLAMHGTSGTWKLGSFQLQNTLVVHDLEKEVVSFVPAECDKII